MVRAHGFEINLSDSDGPQALFHLAREQFGHIDILVNNAAYATETTIEKMRPEDLDRHYAVNLRAMMQLCAEFVRSFSRKGGGRIVNLTFGQGLGPLHGELGSTRLADWSFAGVLPWAAILPSRPATRFVD